MVVELTDCPPPLVKVTVRDMEPSGMLITGPGPPTRQQQLH